ncbi:MAG: LptE family protein [Deltaproteobacteria bacterium]|nr:LptE family protein [Deltaproteobacteria bacterium]
MQIKYREIKMSGQKSEALNQTSSRQYAIGNRQLLLTTCCLLLTVLTACGYRIAGKGGNMPGNITTLSIPFLKNQTQKPDVETVVTTALVDEFVKSGIVRVVEENPEAVLRGAVKSYDLTPVSFSRNDVIQEYRLTIKLEISLVRNSDGKVLWEDKYVTDYEDFKVTATDINITKTAELDAAKKMAKDTARLIKERILEDF